MKVKVISILEDNYMYLVIEEQSKQAVAVDPAVPHRLLEIVKREGLSLTAVLTTHHHWDHARGNEALLKEVPGLRVYGGDDRIGGLTDKVTNAQELKKVFCGHEYTIKNLKFAMLVEPENEKVKEMLSWARARDDDDKPTVPSTLMEEFEYNPFLRLSEEGVQKFTGKTDPVEVLRALRKEKDKFKKPKERLPPHAMLALEWGLLRP
ncbi:hydroxyacylglutathione hydrolase-like protein isoform X2 [Chaetodon auriga]|uniref:hydroxyacylglutathione hydrolase-like protein isoform X2 n=1 Tax=Chaetodon trifascialis TaxID=109706 RepID=UPI0039938C5C